MRLTHRPPVDDMKVDVTKYVAKYKRKPPYKNVGFWCFDVHGRNDVNPYEMVYFMSANNRTYEDALVLIKRKCIRLRLDYVLKIVLLDYHTTRPGISAE